MCAICNICEGFIRIHMATTGNFITIDIEDSGCGISEEHQENLFEKFGYSKHTENFHGSGLGMFITKKLSNLMNGDIKIFSELGKGTKCSVTVCGVPNNTVESIINISETPPRIRPKINSMIHYDYDSKSSLQKK
jgi:K+-sensing histidine kinase KdpD